MSKLSFCCQAEMTEEGQCLSCGADGLTHPTEEEDHEIELREIDEKKELEESQRPDKI